MILHATAEGITHLKEGLSQTEAVRKASQKEDMKIRFYQEAEEQSKPHKADVLRSFSLIVGNRSAHISTLKLI
jgi:hypothetical protein